MKCLRALDTGTNTKWMKLISFTLPFFFVIWNEMILLTWHDKYTPSHHERNEKYVKKYQNKNLFHFCLRLSQLGWFSFWYFVVASASSKREQWAWKDEDCGLLFTLNFTKSDNNVGCYAQPLPEVNRTLDTNIE